MDPINTIFYRLRNLYYDSVFTGSVTSINTILYGFVTANKKSYDFLYLYYTQWLNFVNTEHLFLYLQLSFAKDKDMIIHVAFLQLCYNPWCNNRYSISRLVASTLLDAKSSNGTYFGSFIKSIPHSIVNA